MNTTPLFETPGLQNPLRSGLQRSVADLESSFYDDVDYWQRASLKRQAESALHHWAGELQAAGGNGGDPPGDGLRLSVGLQLLVSYRIALRLNATVAYGRRFSNNASTSLSAHFSAYNSGLGTALRTNRLVVDVSAAALLTVGWGNDTPLQSYALNYNTPIPMLNDFSGSLSYGQALTWNSALNENEFSLDRLQRQGLIGLRVCDVNISTNNDSRRVYRGGDTDMGWTGGFSLVTPLLEIGFQDFTGSFSEEDQDKRKKITDAIKILEQDKSLEKFEKHIQIAALKRELETLTVRPHEQTDYQKTLNKAATYLRLSNSNGYNLTLDVISDAWLQNFIHKKIRDFKFEYHHKNIQTWVGKSW